MNRVFKRNFWLCATLVTTVVLGCIVAKNKFPALIGSEGKNIIALQFAFTKERAASVVASWSHFSIEGFIDAMLYDYFFALSYALLLYALLVRLVEKLHLGRSRYKTVLLLPFVAALFDWFENTIEILYIKSASSISEGLFFTHSLAAGLKWLILGFVFLFILRQWFKKRFFQK